MNDRTPERSSRRHPIMLPGATIGVLVGAVAGGLIGLLISLVTGIEVLIIALAFAVGGGVTGGVIGGFGEMRHVERMEEPETLSDEPAKPHPKKERPVDARESGKGVKQ